MRKLHLISIALAFAGVAQATTFKVTVTNGSSMGISSGVLYTTRLSTTDREVGSLASDGFTAICQNGNASARAEELSGLKNVKTHVQTEGIGPGETKTFMIKVKSPRLDNLHFETMYGRSKDICGVFSISRSLLQKLQFNRYRKLSGKDDVVRTGRFLSPILPQDTAETCREMSATACLRSLSQDAIPVKTIEFFRPYLPSVLSFLDERYGSEEVDTLLIPTGGAIRFTIQRH